MAVAPKYKDDDPSKGTLPEYWDGGAVPTANYPEPNQDFSKILAKQMQQSGDFRSNFQQKSDSLYNPLAAQAKVGLANTIKDTRKNFNNRGLLYSGHRQGAESGARAQTAASLDQARSQINSGLLDQANGLDANAFGTAGAQAGLGAGLGASALNNLSQTVANGIYDDQVNGQLAGSIGGGIGTLGGGLISGLSNRNKVVNTAPAPLFGGN
jgi:hypothetical protein